MSTGGTNPEVQRLSEQQSEAVNVGVGKNDDSIDLAVVFKTLSENRKFISYCALTTCMLFWGVAFLLPNKYTAKASFLPPGAMPSASISGAVSQLGQFGSIGLLGGMGKTASDLYAGILRSDSVLRYMVERFKLEGVYKAKRVSAAELALAQNTTIELGAKDPIITIRVTDVDPNRARDLANGYLDALGNASDTMAFTDAAQRRLFYERQLAREKDALANAEVDLKNSEEKTGLILPTGQAAVQINTVARTRAEIASREVELAALSQYATDQNTDVLMLRNQIASLQKQLKKLQGNSDGDGDIPTGKVPEVALEYVRKQREVKYHESLFEMIARQYEVARIDEAKEGLTLQILDHAVTPDVKSGPHRTLIAAAGLFLGALFSSTWILIRRRKTMAVRGRLKDGFAQA